MRIATIPAALWDMPAMRAADPEVVYLGRMPQRGGDCRDAARLFPRAYHPSSAAYVYILLHVDGSAVYVGKARDPLARFTKHRRREWWEEVYHLLLLRVEGASVDHADVLALGVEALCIRHLSPTYNVAGVFRRSNRGVFA